MLGRQQLGRVLQVRPHFFGDLAHPDRSEVVDGKSRVLRVVHGKETSESRGEIRDSESLGNLGETHLLDHLLHHDLDEDTGRRRCLVLVEVDRVQNGPGDGVGRQKVTEEPADIPQLVRLITMNRVKVFGKRFLEIVGPNTIQLAETLANQAVEVRV